MSTILKVEGLSKWFGKTKAIQNLNFEVKRGQVVGILGPNGSGKTTTLSIILGVKYSSTGAYNWINTAGENIPNKCIGSLIEVPYFYPYLSLEKNLQIAAQIKGASYHQLDEVLRTVGLLNRKTSKFYTLSLGMKQRLAMASALLGNPEVLVLDEPTNGLDPEGIAEVREIITEQSSLGKTIIIASHILDEIEKVCSHVIILNKGNIISQGEVNELLTDKKRVSISSDNMDSLLKVLTSLPNIEILKVMDDSIVVTLEENVSTASINTKLVEMGAAPSAINVLKKTLESQFLELVKSDKTQ